MFSDSYITDVAYIDPSSFQCVLKREKLNLPDSKHNKGRSIYLQILFSIIIDDFSLRKIDDTWMTFPNKLNWNARIARVYIQQVHLACITQTNLLALHARLLRLMNDERFPEFCNLLTWCWVNNLLHIRFMKHNLQMIFISISTNQSFWYM